MLRHNTLQPDRAMLLVIDVQDKLLPMIRHRERVVAMTCKLLKGLAVFEVPVLVTEQYPKGLGRTDANVLSALSATNHSVLEKPSFSACGTDPVRSAMNKLDRPQVIIAGIEAHVCVQQTTLDLCAMDYDVFVCTDAIGSRGKLDYECSLDRMRHAGAAVTTVESVLFELCHRCDAPQFKSMLEVIKAYPPADE